MIYDGNLDPSPHIFLPPVTVGYHLCCSSNRAGLEIMTQASSPLLAWNTRYYSPPTHAQSVQRQPLSSLSSSPFVSLPVLSPSLSFLFPLAIPPSLPFQCSTEGRLTQHFQPGVYECAQESAHRQDYNQLKEAAEDNNGLKDRNDKG